MSRLVMKFGGTSVANLERIRNVAAHVKREVEAGYEVAVVVSAMAGQDQRARRLVQGGRLPLTTTPEYDAVVASGEQVTAGLLALVLQGHGAHGALLGRAGRFRSSPTTRMARPASQAIDGTRLGEGFAAGEIAVVAGFQGVHKADRPRDDARARRLGHVARWRLPRRSQADRCDIYTDVDGVYTTDPRVVPKARRLDRSGVRGNAGNGFARRQGAAGALGRTGDGEQGQDSTCARPSTIRRTRSLARSSATRRISWSRRSSPASPSRATRRRSPCARSPTSRASPRRSSCRWPTPTSMST